MTFSKPLPNKCLFHHLLDIAILGSFLHDGHIRDRNIEGHANELLVQLWCSLVRGLGSSGR